MQKSIKLEIFQTENLGRQYPCNPLWTQLGDLYGALGNPPKLVHTVITGDPEKTALINAVLTFLSYFIRSAIVEKRREYRCTSQQDVQEAILILERMKKKNSSLFKTAKSKTPTNDSLRVGSSGSSRDKSLQSTSLYCQPSKSTTSKCESSNTSPPSDYKPASIDPSIPKLKRTSSAQKNLGLQSPSTFKSQLQYPVKVEPCDPEDTIDVSLDHSNRLNSPEKNCPTNTVKILVSESTTTTPLTPPCDVGATKKRFSRSDLEQKMELGDSELHELTMDSKLSPLRRRTDSGFDSQKFYPGGFNETEAFFARLDIPKDSQQSQVFFTLGDEDKLERQPRSQPDCSCQCSFAFTGVPSTSAELPEGVLRKIIQRNFPESSKSIQRQPGSSKERYIGSCPKCNGAGYAGPQSLEGSKLLLETPTNATEVLRSCGSSVGNRATRLLRSNSLEALMEANGVIELPMPR